MTQTPRDWNLVAMEEDRDFWKCEFDCQKARADAAEFREQRLKEAYNGLLLYVPDVAAKSFGFDTLISTLYPDTPAPTSEEGENHE
ncbi:hypothetical protein H70357_24660 [Paenibacillus sp. FSL H7-0357]|uniref:hypothetical protein n=1 Tax=Paenibacillus sp. FSL H7-0357 TaxID=1536774 RepID=UPI0004F8ABED|nr:hypothetical protein [Paenibacillus sp. FSL H7-0357]AIQ19548.1 hypothetical protein H70357_24660 [Paenibacillus sp. FSL H7-0357]